MTFSIPRSSGRGGLLFILEQVFLLVVFFKGSVVDLQYYVKFQVYNIVINNFKGYTPFIVIIKH